MNGKHSPFQHAFANTIPVMAAHLPLGMVFGLVFEQAGYTWFWAPLMSLCVFGGSVQFLALSMLAAGTSLTALGLAAIPVAIRNTFYGVLLVNRLGGRLPRRLYMAFGLVDATFSVLTNRSGLQGKEDDAYALWVTILNHLYWVFGTVLGVLIGVCLHMELPGLEFCLTALFAGLATEHFLTTRRGAPIFIGALSILLGILIAPAYVVLIGIVTATILFFLGEVRVWFAR